MSYIAKRIRRRQQRVAARPLAMGGLLDAIWGALGAPTDAIQGALKSYGQDKTQACVAAADKYTAALDAKWYSLAQTWNPNPAFAPADLRAILGAVTNVMVQAQTRLLTTPWNTGDAKEVIAQAMGDLTKQIDDTARFQDAASLAVATGSPYVNAPDIKDWVLRSLLAVSGAYAVAYVETCDVTWLEGVLQAIDDVLTSVPHYIGVAIETAVSVAVDAGTAVVDVAAGAFDLAKFVGKYGLLILLGVGGVYAYKHYYAK